MTYWKALLRPVSLLCGLAQPTPADTFLLREKYPKAYLRGFPLDIPWGLRPRSNRKAVTLPPVTKVSSSAGGVERGQGNVLVLAEITLAVIALENLAKLDSPLGGSKGEFPLPLEVKEPTGSL